MKATDYSQLTSFFQDSYSMMLAKRTRKYVDYYHLGFSYTSYCLLKLPSIPSQMVKPYNKSVTHLYVNQIILHPHPSISKFKGRINNIDKETQI